MREQKIWLIPLKVLLFKVQSAILDRRIDDFEEAEADVLSECLKLLASDLKRTYYIHLRVFENPGKYKKHLESTWMTAVRILEPLREKSYFSYSINSVFRSTRDSNYRNTAISCLNVRFLEQPRFRRLVIGELYHFNYFNGYCVSSDAAKLLKFGIKNLNFEIANEIICDLIYILSRNLSNGPAFSSNESVLEILQIALGIKKVDQNNLSILRPFETDQVIKAFLMFPCEVSYKALRPIDPKKVKSLS